MAVAIQQLNARLQQQETTVTVLAQEREKLAQQVQSMHGEHAKTARAGRSSRHTGDRKARPVRRRSDEVRGLVVQTEIAPRSRGSAVSRGVDEDRIIVDTKIQRKPRERGKRSPHADVLHSGEMTTAGAALDKCHNVGVNEGFEAWRQIVMEWEPKLRTRYVGLLMNVLEYRFRDDIPTKLAAFERTVHDYENQSTKTVDDDIKIGVTMLVMSKRASHPEQRQNHKLESDARGESRDHKNTTVHRQSTSANAARSEARAKRAKAKAKARISRAKTRPRM